MHIRPTVRRRSAAVPATTTSEEDGSVVAEYGLVAVLSATIAGIAISWARGGAITSLLTAVLREVRQLVGL